MTKKDMIDTLLAGIEKANAEKNRTVPISIGTASEILALLVSIREEETQRVQEDGKVLFYCADCGQSFWADPREDRECFERWHYHRWFADCPKCHIEVSRNDRYWR